ncbi:hypothetical protein [Marivirga harenae]|uniref:hypothetical protein n=1 Tax=Marivirga harenae TaxID=2010992 RepID=UPI0026DF731C|nr:hypothetical protein [Marivirga harenae]WKV10543.1 hypothetical protein Q3Y49_09990 [Marivirga harenae]|tara:strand:+ start:501385 stop:501672 length:288 start_codon:yes stop_codon:yes gene_type:complete
MEKVLVNKQTEVLVKGEYSAVEAKEIVSNLISQKINFHNLRDFSSHERYGKPDENSLKRIVELKESRKSLLEIIDAAKEEGKAVKINSNIIIELV